MTENYPKKIWKCALEISRNVMKILSCQTRFIEENLFLQAMKSCGIPSMMKRLNFLVVGSNYRKIDKKHLIAPWEISGSEIF